MESLEVKVSTVILLLAGAGILVSLAFIEMHGLGIWVTSLVLALIGTVIKLFGR